jgi:hypothetical protein
MESTEATPEDLPPGVMRKLSYVVKQTGQTHRKPIPPFAEPPCGLRLPPALLLAETKEDRQDHVPNPLKHER